MKSKLISIFVILISLLCIQSFVYAADDDSSSNVTWTDFSKAKYEIKLDKSRADLDITNVTKKDKSLYYYCITANNTKPTIDIKNDVENKGGVLHLLTSLIDNTSSKTNIAEYVELNQDLYLWVIEQQPDPKASAHNIYNYVVEGKKLDRPEYPKYANIFSLTMINSESTQILFNVPWGEHVRKITVKIGKIDDISILNKIKNNEADGFQKLLDYSKSTSEYVYLNNTLTSTTHNYSNSPDGEHYDNGYNDDNNSLPSFSSDFIDDDKYYYLYAKLDDENGKYYPVEAATIALATKSDDSQKYFLFFLGQDDFKWNFSNSINTSNNPTETTKPTSTTPATTTPTASSKKDTTVAKTSLPFAGNKALILLIVVTTLLILAIVGKVQYNKYKDIK